MESVINDKHCLISFSHVLSLPLTFSSETQVSLDNLNLFVDDSLFTGISDILCIRMNKVSVQL